jgi:hypothetical protein
MGIARRSAWLGSLGPGISDYQAGLGRVEKVRSSNLLQWDVQFRGTLR